MGYIRASNRSGFSSRDVTPHHLQGLIAIISCEAGLKSWKPHISINGTLIESKHCLNVSWMTQYNHLVEVEDPDGKKKEDKNKTD
jgi:hypothetical protein